MFFLHSCLHLRFFLWIYKFYLALTLLFWIKFSAFQHRQGGTPLAVSSRVLLWELISGGKKGQPDWIQCASHKNQHLLNIISCNLHANFHKVQLWFAGVTTEQCESHELQLKSLSTRPDFGEDFSCHGCWCHCCHPETKIFHFLLCLNITRQLHLKWTGHVTPYIPFSGVWIWISAILGIKETIQKKKIMFASISIQQWNKVEEMQVRPLFWYLHGHQLKPKALVTQNLHIAAVKLPCCACLWLTFERPRTLQWWLRLPVYFIFSIFFSFLRQIEKKKCSRRYSCLSWVYCCSTSLKVCLRYGSRTWRECLREQNHTLGWDLPDI